jgi:hypothetical protein
VSLYKIPLSKHIASLSEADILLSQPLKRINMGSLGNNSYSSVEESKRIFNYLCDQFDDTALPAGVKELRDSIQFTSSRDAPYFPIPFKETETTAALKAVEGAVACLLANSVTGEFQPRKMNINLEKTTAFLCQAYMAKVGGLGKLDPGVKSMLKGQYLERILMLGRKEIN